MAGCCIQLLFAKQSLDYLEAEATIPQLLSPKCMGERVRLTVCEQTHTMWTKKYSGMVESILAGYVCMNQSWSGHLHTSRGKRRFQDNLVLILFLLWQNSNKAACVQNETKAQACPVLWHNKRGWSIHNANRRESMLALCDDTPATSVRFWQAS